MLVVEAKLKNGTPEQYHLLDEAIRTSQFVRNSCVRCKIKFTDGFKAGEFDLWCSQKTLVYYSEQQIKRVRVVRRADGYYCQFLIDGERQEYHKPTGQITGIDLGLKEFYTDAQGNTVENLRYLRKSEK